MNGAGIWDRSYGRDEAIAAGKMPIGHRAGKQAGTLAMLGSYREIKPFQRK